MVMVPLGQWLPDLHPVGDGLAVCKNVVPRGDGYGPARQAVTLDRGALSAACRGAATGSGRDAVAYLVAGDASKLYIATTGDLTDESKVGGYTTPATGGWEFAQYGNRIMATNFADAIQSFVLGSSSAFADLAAAAPKARHIDVIRSFVVTGNTTDASDGDVPERVWWSAIENPASWPTVGSDAAKAVQSDQQDLVGSYGGVQRVVGGPDYGVVFQERAIWRMDYAGGDVFWQFTPVETNRGCLIPGSAIRVGRIIFYCSEDGWYAFDGSGSTAIGFERIDRTFFGDLDGDYLHRVTAAIDPRSQCVCWLYPGDGHSEGTPNRMLRYHYALDRWSLEDETAEALVRVLLSSGTTLDDMTGDLDDPEEYPESFDFIAYAASVPALGGFNALHQPVSFTGPMKTGRIVTRQFASDNRMRWVKAIRPVIEGTEGSAVTAVVRVGHRNSHLEELSYTDYRAANSIGRYDFRAPGRYHAADFTLIDDFDHFVGFEPEIVEVGRR